MPASVHAASPTRLAAAPLGVGAAFAAIALAIGLAGLPGPSGAGLDPAGQPAFANPLVVDAGVRVGARPPGDLGVQPSDPVLGSGTALVTIVVFSDFQCPFCGRVEPTMQALRVRYGNDLRVVWKDFPLAFHNQAKPAAIAARTVFLARGNAAFWTAHATLFARQRDLQAAIPAVLAAASIDDATAKRLAPEATRLVEDGVALGGEVGVNGTPAFLIDGELLSGARDESAFAEIIDRHLIEAKSLVAAGVPTYRLYAAMLARRRPRGDAGP